MSNPYALEKLKFLTEKQARAIAQQHGTPVYVNSRAMFTKQVESITRVKMKTPLAIRYAMKANPNTEVLKLMKSLGVKIDASSSYEVEHALAVGFAPSDILLTGQELPKDMKKFIKTNVHFNATSLHQLEEYGKVVHGANVTVRINPGVGSGYQAKVTTAGVSAGFGIWHEYLDKVFEAAKRYNLVINRLHTHIGVGNDPKVWERVLDINLGLVKQMPAVTTLNIGGGFKHGRMSYEKSANMNELLAVLDTKIQEFNKKNNRNITVEIEPGTYLAACSAAIICEVIDITDTGKRGYTFVRTNTGMNDILRPALHGAQHPLVSVSRAGATPSEAQNYIVIGHCCESSDTLTFATGDNEQIQTATMHKLQIGDYIVIEGCGAYCASMSAKGYNGFPSTPEIMV